MPFNRPPRIQKSLPDDTVAIPKPPAIPSKPETSNWLTTVLPIGGILLSVILMIVFMGSGSSSMSYLIFIPIMLVSSFAGIITGQVQKKEYARKLAEAHKKFKNNLVEVENRLNALREKELKLRIEKDPDPGECVRRVQSRAPSLGERRSFDPDFLCPRLGIGDVPSSYHLQIPDIEEYAEEYKDEINRVNQICTTYLSIPKAPLVTRLPITGSIGLAGVRTEVLDVTRSFLVHILTHHWVSEVSIAIICKPEYSPEWDWVQSLPNTFAPLKSAKKDVSSTEDAGARLSKFMAALETELQRREQIFETSKVVHRGADSSTPSVPLPRLVIVLDYLDPTFSHPALMLLLKKGRELGVYGLFLTHKPEQIPGECGAIQIIRGNRLVYEESGTEGRKLECYPDRINLDQVKVFAKTLSSIEWSESKDTTLPPGKITFLELFGVSRVEELPLETWWDNQSPYGFFRAPIGKISDTQPMIFDLNDRDGAHGPHGLLGGMTGSGKSEVLKAIILALAVTHHPYDLNFALIDFKGGAAFNELALLPHTVGVVTDIESNATYAERVILSLAGEIERRKRVIEGARAAFLFGKSHIDEYHGLNVKKPLPRLVIVFDEFAEFKSRYKEESKKLISIARLGRSLGVHLILATQNIEAAIDPEILQNSTFRICLKVSTPEDSVQMVGIPDAVNLTRGRAYFSANTRVLYQSAYSGATYTKGGDQVLPNIFTRVWPDGRRDTIEVTRQRTAVRQFPTMPPATEASAVVEHIIATAQKLRIKRPLQVWPEALPERVYLPDLLQKSFSGGWDGEQWNLCRSESQGEIISDFAFPILGLYDYPAKQKQPLLQISPDQGGGNLLVFGSAGSGKSTLIRTLVTSLALTQPTSDVNIYILDFGGQSALKVLEEFPHVGAVVTRLELERAERLIQFIQTEVLRRNELLRKAHVDNWIDYNSQAQFQERLPALYLIIDGFGNFKQRFVAEDKVGFIDSVAKLVSGGQASGLYMIVASNLQSDIPEELFANINMRLTFNQAKPTEYYNIVGQPSEAKIQEDSEKGLRPGRGLLRGTPPFEFQAALPVIGETDKEQVKNLVYLASKINKVWTGVKPQEIRDLPLLLTLPQQVEIKRLTGRVDLEFGQDFETLSPIGFALDQDGPSFLISGVASQTGKTTLLQTWVIGLVEKFSPDQLQLILIDFHTRSLSIFRNLPHVKAYVGARLNLESTLTALSKEIKKRRAELEADYQKDPDKFDSSRALSKWPHIVVVIDDYGKFDLMTRLGSEASAESRLMTDCLQQGGDYGTSYIIAGAATELPSDYQDPFIQRFRRQGCGVLLGGVEGIDGCFNNVKRPTGQPSAGLPPGRGYLVNRGIVRLFQTAVCWEANEQPNEALLRRVENVSKRYRRKKG